MSQYESLALIALGAILALIVVIIFSRSLWEAAVLVMRRRRENETPAKIITLEAQRDQFRAEAAMSSARMEATVKEIQDKLVANEADMSRIRNTNLQLTQDLAQRDKHIDDQAQALVKLNEKHDEAEQLARMRGDALKDLDAQLSAKGSEIATYKSEVARLETKIEEMSRASVLRPVEVEPVLHARNPTDISPFMPTARPTYRASEIASQSSIAMAQTPVDALTPDSKADEKIVTDLESRRAKVLRKGASLAEITERLKSMKTAPEKT